MIEELEEKNNKNENSVDRRLIEKDKQVEGLKLFLCKILSSTIMIWDQSCLIIHMVSYYISELIATECKPNNFTYTKSFTELWFYESWYCSLEHAVTVLILMHIFQIIYCYTQMSKLFNFLWCQYPQKKIKFKAIDASI